MQFDQLRRREFIALLGGAAATWPLVARAQQPASTLAALVFSYLVARARRWFGVGQLEAFRQGLKEYGWIEGQNISVEYRFAEGKEDELLGRLQKRLGRTKDELRAEIEKM